MCSTGYNTIIMVSMVSHMHNPIKKSTVLCKLMYDIKLQKQHSQMHAGFIQTTHQKTPIRATAIG